MLILLLSCFSAKNNQTKLSSFDKQGHRGCRGLMPENTIPAMLKAIDLGVTTLETDVVITADQQVILSHEPFFSHDITTKPDGSYVTAEEEKKLNIFQMDYATVRKYDVGSKPFSRFPKQQKIATYKPLLSDMIDSVLAYCTKMGKPVPAFNIETKSQPTTDGIFHPAPALFVDLIMEVIHRKQIQEKTTIQSFDIRTLQYLHQKYPSIPTALLIEGNHPQTFALQLKELGFVPTIYSPYFSLVTPLLVKQCRDLGVKLIPWTVNDRAKIQELRKLGVDGIITDFPDLF